MAAGLINQTIGDGQGGTIPAKMLSSTGAAGGNLSPAPTLFDSAGNEVLGKVTDGAYAGTGNTSVFGLLMGLFGTVAQIGAANEAAPAAAATASGLRGALRFIQNAYTTFGSIFAGRAVLYDSTGNAIDFTGASPTYPLPGTPVSGPLTTAITDTADHLVLAAPGAGLRNYITSIVISNSHATVGTDVVLKDGAGGAVLGTYPAAALYGGVALALPTPLKQPTANTAIYAADLTTGASVKVTLTGFAAV